MKGLVLNSIVGLMLVLKSPNYKWKFQDQKYLNSQLKLKKFMDEEKKIYNESDKKSLDYLIENSE